MSPLHIALADLSVGFRGARRLRTAPSQPVNEVQILLATSTKEAFSGDGSSGTSPPPNLLHAAEASKVQTSPKGAVAYSQHAWYPTLSPSRLVQRDDPVSKRLRTIFCTSMPRGRSRLFFHPATLNSASTFHILHLRYLALID